MGREQRVDPGLEVRLVDLDHPAAPGAHEVLVMVGPGELEVGVVAADVDASKPDRLANTIAQRRAKLLLKYADDLFN